ncbi:hypothetical protein [Acidovorax sp. sic0104]|uniref:hypothetical protein n=1 Tax=Acidovorax sp. sic0104 TaxID=2854784 RepID=UPI001C482B8D|nr:hypothetical protein [Acidovorax sp. sic0104]MBV7542034.1 hypothetical protein [Acidovorax sp. sic0104]
MAFLTFSMLLQMLVEAEGRRDDIDFPKDVRERSAETVALCNERLAKEGITRAELEQLAAEEA